MIKAGQFIRLDGEGKRLLFVESRDPELMLKGVVISDHTNQNRPFTIFAESGSFAFEQKTAVVTLMLENGDIHFETESAKTADYRRIAFGDASYTFDLGDMLGSNINRLRPPELDTSELQAVLSNFNQEGFAPAWARVRQIEPYQIHLHRRWAIPFSSVLFAFLGVALGIRRTRGARSWGALLCVVIVFFYYTTLSFGIYLAENGLLPTLAGLWLPNVLTAGLALVVSLHARRIEL
jgi:lipopolysaccharide export system permease protein